MKRFKYFTILTWFAVLCLADVRVYKAQTDQKQVDSLNVAVSPFLHFLQRAEGGKPPADFAQYKLKGWEWDRRVGWL
jgi:hypothetical protein